MVPLRLAFIGCGGHASNLIRQTPLIPEIDLVAVCDLDAERARLAARRFGALASYDDYQKMLDAERPDAVAVVGPPPMEVEIGADVLGQGYHVYVEKPIGRNSHEARPLVEAAWLRGSYVRSASRRRRGSPARARPPRSPPPSEAGPPPPPRRAARRRASSGSRRTTPAPRTAAPPGGRARHPDHRPRPDRSRG